jgi:hypothetical protein
MGLPKTQYPFGYCNVGLITRILYPYGIFVIGACAGFVGVLKFEAGVGILIILFAAGDEKLNPLAPGMYAPPAAAGPPTENA